MRTLNKQSFWKLAALSADQLTLRVLTDASQQGLINPENFDPSKIRIWKDSWGRYYPTASTITETDAELQALVFDESVVYRIVDPSQE